MNRRVRAAHDRAFVVAGALKADLLDDLQQSVTQAIEEGKSIQWFRKEFGDIVAKHGWTGWTGEGSPAGVAWRTRVIYQTNLTTSYAAGRFAQLNDPDLLKHRPYWKYVHNDTVQHPRPLHVAWGNQPVVLPPDDPWWRTHFPPNGWGCRCRVVAVRAEEYRGQPAPEDGTWAKTDRYGVTHAVPKGLDYGWDYAPGANRLQPFQALIDDKLIRFPAPLGAALWQALKPVLLAERTQAVQRLIDLVASGPPKSEYVVAHVVDPATVAALERHGVTLDDAAVWLRDHELAHALREIKEQRAAALPLAVWSHLPSYLDAARPYLDKTDQALVYGFDLPERAGKVVIRIHYQSKVRDGGEHRKVRANFIRTGGLVDASNFGEDRYIPLWKTP